VGRQTSIMIDRHIDADLVTQVKFTGISRPVVFVGCQDLIPVIRSVLRGWPMREIDVSPCHDAVITIRKETGGYRRGYRRESH